MAHRSQLIAALDPLDQAKYHRGVWLKMLDGGLAGCAVVFGFACLIWFAQGGESWTIVAALCVGNAALVGIRYLVAGQAMRRLYLPTYKGGVKTRAQVLHHLTRLPVGVFRKLHPGKVAQTLSEDMTWLENETCFFRPSFLAECLTLAALLGSVMWLHWPSAVATIILWGLGLLVLRYFSQLLKVGLRFRSDGMAEASRHVMEFGEGMMVIRAFGNTNEAERDYDKWISIMRDGFRKAIWRKGPVSAGAQGIAVSAVGIGALVTVLTMSVDGDLTVIIAAVGLLAATLIPARNMIVHATIAKLADVGRQNIEQILSYREIDDGDAVSEPGPAQLEFKEVSFSYDGERQALTNASFSAKPGTMTAIIGRSGSGKTTLANLMLRFWDVQDGDILIDGQSIRDFTIESYINRFAVVFQETYLFQDTIESNIQIGNPSASFAEIEQAARQAQIHETIVGLPKGYHEFIGAGGSTLSGGEKQRIAIARAMLKDADVVILDEATSALDPENEREIQLAFEALAKDKTLFVIAHRLSTIINADNILLLDEGHIVDQGNHTDLMSGSELYRHLWDRYQAISEWQL